MGNINHSYFINLDPHIPGPRINATLIDNLDLTQSPSNMLYQEKLESERRYEELMDFKDKIPGKYSFENISE